MEKKILIKALIIIASIAFGIGYFILFFQKGINLERVFIKQSKGDQELMFSSIAYGENVHIAVEGDMEVDKSAIVTYQIGDMVNQSFEVKEVYTEKHGRETQIYKDDQLKFRGIYQSEGLILELDEHGEIMPFGSQSNSWNQVVFSPNYQVSYGHIIRTAYQDNIITRGNVNPLFMAIVILIIWGIDVKWPLLFFSMKYVMSVENPEPSAFYIMIQKATRVIYPIISFILLIVALVGEI